MGIVRGGLAAIVGMVVATGAWAQPPSAEDTAKDANCIVVIALVATTAPEELRSGLASGLSYYVGRIEGRDPKANLESLVRASAERMTDSTLQAERQRCGKEMVTMGDKLTALATALQATPKPR